MNGFLSFLFDLRTIAGLIIITIGIFLYWMIAIGARDRLKAAEIRNRPKVTLITEGGRQVDLYPFVKDVKISPEQEHEWTERLATLPDSSMTIELDTVEESAPTTEPLPELTEAEAAAILKVMTNRYRHGEASTGNTGERRSPDEP